MRTGGPRRAPTLQMTTYPPWVPGELAVLLDADEVVPYDGDVALQAEALARALGVFIAPYRSDPARVPEHLQLCQTFAPASLGSEEIQQLVAAERRNPGVVFVAYARPLRRR